MVCLWQCANIFPLIRCIHPLRHQYHLRTEFEAWSQANNKYHVSGYNPHSDLWEAWQAARRAQVAAVDRVIAAQAKQGGM